MVRRANEHSGELVKRLIGQLSGTSGAQGGSPGPMHDVFTDCITHHCALGGVDICTWWQRPSVKVALADRLDGGRGLHVEASCTRDPCFWRARPAPAELSGLLRCGLPATWT